MIFTYNTNSRCFICTFVVHADNSNQSANILAIFSYTFSTPYLVVKPYIKALIAKGHNVTVISSVNLLPDIDGVRHIRAAALDQVIDHIINFEFDTDVLTNKWKEGSLSARFHYNISRSILSDVKVQSLLKDQSEHFDMVVLEPTHSDALIGFAEHFNAPQVGLSAIGCSWLVDYQAGNSAPSVYRPISPMGYSRGKSLVDKWNNWIYITEEWMMDRLVYLPGQLELFVSYFSFPPEKFYERRRNFSLMLINQHFSLGRVRSNVPNVIEVGGMHMAEPSVPLEPELLDFLNGAEHGAIYFSLGMEILNKWLPKNMEQTMLQTFSQLKQRVVWKHEMETMPNKSDNIYLSSMASQRQLLEHPNVKLFITHGGLLSLIEAAYSGVPMLGLPIYFDQFDNVERMQQAGVALSMDFNAVTAEQLTHNIKELLENPCYALKAKELSARFRDQPTSPLERAVWWTEYVLRHKGAPHMRMAEHEMGFVPYYRIHFIAILYGRIAIAAFILIFVTFMVVNCVLKELRRIFGPPVFYTAL
ncbi:UDP-glucuronosyltransferase 2C1-like [Drosophila innubila]|uniref:UDP-glucuronosyltransferase 2C1-like n=1 Tax=Drosophila innubila TaxID=198719 RepID=UPI00148BA6B0|nr:UDP-glucuronosyltransferase 2C1-like [Drosophila innubila]